MKTVVVVGAGPAGITAAIYLKRGGFNPILIEKMMPGGKVSLTHKIDNYPGFSSIGGSDFANNLMEQLMQNEIEITFDEVIGVSRKDVGFSVKTLSTCYDADAVIISTGTIERKLGIPGEKEFFAKGVSTCAVCDGGFFKGQPMAIIGGGNSALEEALYLTSLTEKVYVVHRRNEFRGALDSVEKVQELKNIGKIELITPAEVVGLVGNDKLEEVVIKRGDEVFNRECDHFIPLFGLAPKLGPLSDWGLEIEKNAIKVDNSLDYQTNIPGVYAIGDINTYPGKLKLILCGFHEATLMCQSAYQRIFPDKRYVMKYTTVGGVQGFDGSKKEAPKAVIKAFD